MKFFSLTCSLAVALILAGCEGPVGPEGADGTANMQVITMTLSISQFQSSGMIETASRSMPELTAAIAQGGLVLAYSDLGSGQTDTWFALPLTIPFQDNLINVSYAYSPGQFAIQLVRETGVAVAPTVAGHTIKVVLISPSLGKQPTWSTSDIERLLGGKVATTTI